MNTEHYTFIACWRGKYENLFTQQYHIPRGRFILIICILLKQITLEDKRRNKYYSFGLLAHICRGSGWSSVFGSLTSDHKPNTTNVGSCPDKRTCVSQNRSTQRSGLEITGRVSLYLNACCKNKMKNTKYH
jgi:hypothetical protein